MKNYNKKIEWLFRLVVTLVFLCATSVAVVSISILVNLGVAAILAGLGIHLGLRLIEEYFVFLKFLKKQNN